MKLFLLAATAVVGLSIFTSAKAQDSVPVSLRVPAPPVTQPLATDTSVPAPATRPAGKFVRASELRADICSRHGQQIVDGGQYQGCVLPYSSFAPTMAAARGPSFVARENLQPEFWTSCPSTNRFRFSGGEYCYLAPGQPAAPQPAVQRAPTDFWSTHRRPISILAPKTHGGFGVMTTAAALRYYGADIYSQLVEESYTQCADKLSIQPSWNSYNSGNLQFTANAFSVRRNGNADARYDSGNLVQQLRQAVSQASAEEHTMFVNFCQGGNGFPSFLQQYQDAYR